MTLRPLCFATLAFVGVAGASPALALGFGRVPESVVLGQALDLAVPLRLDPGETVGPGCVQAEVQVGDHRLPPGALQLAVEGQGSEARVRIRSSAVVLEPLVAVNLSVGCGSAVSRQFVVFADPADSRNEPAPPATPLVPTAAAVATPVEPTPARAKTVAKATSRKPAGEARTAGTRTAANATPRRAPRRDTVAAKSAAPRAQAAAPRLKLEEPDELLKAAAATVAAQDAALAVAAQAASAAQAAASAAEQRLAQMESNLKQLREDAAAQRVLSDQLRQRLAQADEQARWQPLLFALAAALALAVLGLGWRLRALQRERQAAWWQGATPAPEAQAEALPSNYEPPPPDTVPPILRAPAEPGRTEDDSPAMQRTAPLPPQALEDDSLTRSVSVDELIDLEQQAEFFVVLGEEDAAVDLLMAHLRSTGGTSPLPYLKLLEIFRRRQDREAYERIRRRFGQRFNAVAPEWEADPDKGRDLLDYPEVLAALQAKWPQPLDAMAELENLLFRRRGGELFELPAYRDVLALFSVARELNRQVEDAAADVDVLLPLGDAGDGRSGPPSIFDSDFSDGGELRTLEDRPTAPVDLDLTEPVLPADSRAGALAPVRATLRLD